MSKTIRICWHPVKGGAIARAYVIHEDGGKTDRCTASDDGALKACRRVENEVRRRYHKGGVDCIFLVELVGKVRMNLAEAWIF